MFVIKNLEIHISQKLKTILVNYLNQTSNFHYLFIFLLIKFFYILKKKKIETEKRKNW